MTPLIHDPVDLRNRGFAALVAALGWINAVRFMQQYERHSGDYTKERDQLLPNWDAATLLQKARERA
jgi:hypothetical protein